MLGSMLGSLPIWHWLIVLAVVLILFAGRGSIESFMNDFARGMGEHARADESLQRAAGTANRWLAVAATVLAVAYAVGLIVMSVWS
jgi:sec-independent protein translocase protein TatA